MPSVSLSTFRLKSAADVETVVLNTRADVRPGPNIEKAILVLNPRATNRNPLPANLPREVITNSPFIWWRWQPRNRKCLLRWGPCRLP
jgi:hypothetical protein